MGTVSAERPLIRPISDLNETSLISLRLCTRSPICAHYRNHTNWHELIEAIWMPFLYRRTLMNRSFAAATGHHVKSHVNYRSCIRVSMMRAGRESRSCIPQSRLGRTMVAAMIAAPIAGRPETIRLTEGHCNDLVFPKNTVSKAPNPSACSLPAARAMASWLDRRLDRWPVSPSTSAHRELNMPTEQSNFRL